MKKNILSIATFTIALFISTAQAQVKETPKDTITKKGYVFTLEKNIAGTPVKDQCKSGTCWSFSTCSFFESEMIRLGKPATHLSEMFIVWNTYSDKATRYIRMHGKQEFAAGGSSLDVLNCIKEHGIVPDEKFLGLNYGEKKHIHGEMDLVLKSMLDAVLENFEKTNSPSNRTHLTTAWKNAFNGALSAYLGTPPTEFEYNGKKYTPQTFAKETGINPDDYIEITSFSHHPFNKPFVMEVQDNWNSAQVYNVPLDDFAKILDNAVSNGFTIAWGSDISEKGFSGKNGVAVVPETNLESTDGTERARWEKLSDKEKDAELYKFEKPIKEKVITQEMRQAAFDNFETTDDHGMEIVGKAKDQNGTKYYYVKNSWGDSWAKNGYFYASEAFVLYKTTAIMIHKDALPKDIRKKLDIK